MYTIRALGELYGLSPKQARDRVTALKPLINAYAAEGKDNAIQYTEHGRAMFDRLLQIERENSVTIKAAAEQVKEEIQSQLTPQNGHVDDDLLDRLHQLERQLEEQYDTYEKRLEEFQRKLTKHDSRLSEIEEQVQYMLEPPAEEAASADDESHGESTAAVAEPGSGERGSDEEPDVPTEVAVDGDLPRWRRALANLPLISRMLS